MKINNGIVDTAIQKLIPISNLKARPRYPMTAEFMLEQQVNKTLIMLLIKMNISHGTLLLGMMKYINTYL